MKMYGSDVNPKKGRLEIYYEWSTKARRRMKRWVHKIARMNSKKDLRNRENEE